MTTLSWLHLSDLHLRGTETSVDIGHFRDMLTDIKKEIKKEKLSLDAVFFTGDVAFDAHLREFAAGASLQANYHAYNLVRLNLDKGSGTAIVRLQHPDIGGNWGADSFTYRNAKNGKITFSLVSH